MKKLCVFSISFLLFFTTTLKSQNVGIGTNTPQSKLEINGDIAFKSADITISTVYNYALDVNTVKQSFYKLKAPIIPIGNFIIAGITAAANGRLITLANRTGTSMEIYNDDLTANAADRIQTGTGSTIAVYAGGSITLQYDEADQRWSIKSMHNNSLDYFGGGGGTSYWDISGNNIYTNTTGNVGIGNNTPAYKLDVNGNLRTKGNGLTANGVNGGALVVAANDLPGTKSQYLTIDGQQIQSLGSANIGTVATPKDLLLNSFGGNVGIGTNSPSYKLDVVGNMRTISSSISGGGADGGVLRVASNDLPGTQTQFLTIDGQRIQSMGSSNIGTVPTAKNLLINPFGGNVGIRTSAADATLSVARGNGTDGTAAFEGTNHTSHFNYSTNENTYIRGGKSGSTVYINDTHNGNVNIGSTGKVNVGQGGMFSTQTGNLNLVPLGIFKYEVSNEDDIDRIIVTSTASNIAGNVISNYSYNISYAGSLLMLRYNFNPSVVAGYSQIILIGTPEFSFVVPCTTARKKYLAVADGGPGVQVQYISDGNAFDKKGFSASGEIMVYGVK